MLYYILLIVSMLVNHSIVNWDSTKKKEILLILPLVLDYCKVLGWARDYRQRDTIFVHSNLIGKNITIFNNMGKLQEKLQESTVQIMGQI